MPQRQFVDGPRPWESEPEIDLSQYHRAKTARFFLRRDLRGALARRDPGAWRPLGEFLG